MTKEKKKKVITAKQKEAAKKLRDYEKIEKNALTLF